MTAAPSDARKRGRDAPEPAPVRGPALSESLRQSLVVAFSGPDGPATPRLGAVPELCQLQRLGLDLTALAGAIKGIDWVNWIDTFVTCPCDESYWRAPLLSEKRDPPSLHSDGTTTHADVLLAELARTVDGWLEGVASGGATAQGPVRRSRLLGLRDGALRTLQAKLLPGESSAAGGSATKKRAGPAKKKIGKENGAVVLAQDKSLIAPSPSPSPAPRQALPPAELLSVCSPSKLPASVRANREPYKPGEWRIEPFAARPYERLSGGYHIPEAQWAETIARKLRTSKRGGCDGAGCADRGTLGSYNLAQDRFDSGCPCLAAKTECDAHCACDARGGLNGWCCSWGEGVAGSGVSGCSLPCVHHHVNSLLQPCSVPEQGGVLGPRPLPRGGRGGAGRLGRGLLHPAQHSRW